MRLDRATVFPKQLSGLQSWDLLIFDIQTFIMSNWYQKIMKIRIHGSGFDSRCIYVFDNRLVDTLNNSIGQDPNSKYLIGVLDIYGFESFKTNR